MVADCLYNCFLQVLKVPSEIGMQAFVTGFAAADVWSVGKCLNSTMIVAPAQIDLQAYHNFPL